MEAYRKHIDNKARVVKMKGWSEVSLALILTYSE